MTYIVFKNDTNIARRSFNAYQPILVKKISQMLL